MRPILRFISIFCAAVILNLMGMADVYPGLPEIRHRELRIAYMNGFIDALELPVDFIEKTKIDPELLKKQVRASADSYMETVERMQN